MGQVAKSGQTINAVNGHSFIEINGTEQLIPAINNMLQVSLAFFFLKGFNKKSFHCSGQQ